MSEQLPVGEGVPQEDAATQYFRAILELGQAAINGDQEAQAILDLLKQTGLNQLEATQARIEAEKAKNTLRAALKNSTLIARMTGS